MVDSFDETLDSVLPLYQPLVTAPFVALTKVHKDKFQQFVERHCKLVWLLKCPGICEVRVEPIEVVPFDVQHVLGVSYATCDIHVLRQLRHEHKNVLQWSRRSQCTSVKLQGGPGRARVVVIKVDQFDA